MASSGVTAVVLALVSALWCAANAANAQLSRPLATEAHAESLRSESKFAQRRAITGDRRWGIAGGAMPATAFRAGAGAEARLRWLRELSGDVDSTPIVVQMRGMRTIVAADNAARVEVLDGSDGSRVNGFEAAPADAMLSGSSVRSSPVLFDINNDGVDEIMLATYDGELLFYLENGNKYFVNLRVPRLWVKRTWFLGLDADGADRGQRDVLDDGAAASADGHGAVSDADGRHGEEDDVDDEARRVGAVRRHMERRRNLQDVAVTAGHGDEVSDMDVEEALEAGRGDADEYEYQDDWYDWYDDYLEDDEWDDDEYYHYYDHGGDHEQRADGAIDVDAHILSSPAIGDIDGDGTDELVIAVSYFFSEEYFGSEEHSHELPEGVDIQNYFATGIVVYDLQTLQVKWDVHLDLTTSSSKMTAKAFASPTLVDIDGDGKLEVLVSTSLGFVYALTAGGENIDGWPIQMGEIRAQVAAADVNGDLRPEIIAVDTHGNVAAFDARGRELWERHCVGSISRAASIGDVDGDGNLDVIVTTAEGYIYALRGDDGGDLDYFPHRAHGAINARALVTKAHDATKGLQIIVPSDDGYLYIVDGEGRADSIDLGDTAVAQPLAAGDLNDDGLLDIVVSSVDGNVYVFELPHSRYHPLKTQTREDVSAARYEHVGIFAAQSSRNQSVSGKSIVVSVDIVDTRRRTGTDKESTTGLGPYSVSVTLLGHRPMRALRAQWEFDAPGSYALMMDSLQYRCHGTIRIEMRDAGGALYLDEFPVSFHTVGFRALKFFIVGPITIMAVLCSALLSAASDKDGQTRAGALPS